MAFAESKPVFKDRAVSAGLSEEVYTHLQDAGLDTLSKFAFASSYVPGAGDDSEFVKTMKTVLSRDATLAELASFRKLLHEAYSLVTQEMKQQLERSEDVHARKLTQPERADLYERQVKRITGLTLRGPLEPSDALVDVFCAMYEANRIRFVAWEKYTAKEAELDKDVRTEHLFAVDSSGKLKVEGKKADPIADTSTEILLNMRCKGVDSVWTRPIYLSSRSTSFGLTGFSRCVCKFHHLDMQKQLSDSCLKPIKSFLKSFQTKHVRECKLP